MPFTLTWRLVHDASETIVTIDADEITLGRGRENDLQLPVHHIARRHALLRREPDGRYRLFDLQSRNGVWFQRAGVPSEGVLLSDGDVFQLADVAVVVREVR